MTAVNKQVKGLLKGLRYISQIFVVEDDEKEPEMVIGNPTDVRHVAHIGWDGPSVNSPGWLNGFQSTPPSTTIGHDGKGLGSPKLATQEIPPSPSRDDASSPKPRRSRRNIAASDAGSDSPSRDQSSRGSRHSRKHNSTGSALASESSSKDESGSTRHSRTHNSTRSALGSESPSRDESGSTRRNRHHHSKPDNNIVGSESPVHELPSIPKQARKKERKSRGSDGGSTRSRPKNPSFLEPGQEEKISRPVTVEEAV